MKQFIVFLLLTLALSSCYKKVHIETKKPSHFLSEDSLVLILTEIQMAEGAINYRRIEHLPNNNARERYYTYVFKKFKVTPFDLKENLDYYNGNPEKMIEIYDKVLANLLKLEGEIDLKLKIREQYIKDSLALVDTSLYVRKYIPRTDLQFFSNPYNWPILKK